MNSLKQRIAYLGLADLDYLSARVLLRNGLMNTGLPRAAEAFEKIFKLILILEARINRGEELLPRHLKVYRHNVAKLFAAVKAKLGVPYPSDYDAYFAMLSDAYDRRYPEHWRAFRAEVSLDALDALYANFRSNAASNFPLEDQPRTRDFETFIMDAYSPSIVAQVRDIGGQSPKELLVSQNQHLAELAIDLDRVPDGTLNRLQTA